MEGSRTARVLVLDNDATEACDVMRVLAHSGVAAVYHSGELVADDPTKLQGIRLMFVDMVLENLGASSAEPKSCAEITTNALQAVVDDEERPVVVACWTTHHDDREILEEFRAAFVRKFPKFQAQFVEVFNKAALRADLAELTQRIKSAVQSLEPLNLLFHWEQQVHDAATRTTAALTRLAMAQRTPESWRDQAYNVFATLASAERGERLEKETEQHAIKAFYSVLTPLLGDALVHAEIDQNTANPAVGRRLMETVRKMKPRKMPAESDKIDQNVVQAPVSAEFVSKLNSMLLTARDLPSEIAPGAVVLVPRNSENRRRVDTWLEWQELCDDTFFGASGKLPDGYLPVFVEVTPVCDFAQNNQKTVRFIAGFLFKADGQLPLRAEAHYLRKYGPFDFDLSSQGGERQFLHPLPQCSLRTWSKEIDDQGASR